MTGFKSYDMFLSVLKFVLPGLDRKNIIYWNTKAAKRERVNVLFDSDDSDESEEESNDVPVVSNSYTFSNHTLSVEDEFLLVMMKLRMGLTNMDLTIRFNISESTVSKILITWINFLYVRLGQLKIWPHRNIIINNMPNSFKEMYPNNIVIIDCTELKIQCPSALVMQSQSYSSYKSTNTLKGLVGIEPNGGFIFVSQLYTGSISDKEIVKRSGFLEILKKKIEVEEILDQDSVMADKGFEIVKELADIGLNLNIPPFLKNKPQFNLDEVIQTQSIARHRIHVERAIGKVRNFAIFQSKFPISLLGSVNQIWTVCCLLSNFMDPIL